MTNYSTVSEKQQAKMSHTLSELSMGSLKRNSSEFTEKSSEVHSASDQIQQHGQQAMSLFSGAVIHGGQFSISINSLNQSPRLTIQEAKGESSPKRYKRLKVLDSDSD